VVIDERGTVGLAQLACMQLRRVLERCRGLRQLLRRGGNALCHSHAVEPTLDFASRREADRKLPQNAATDWVDAGRLTAAAPV
jgi:hypothetical protein